MPAPQDHAAACPTGAQPTPAGGARWGVWRRLALWARFHAGLPAPFTRPDWSQAQRLVFVCLANLNRSALAQALCEQSGIPTASCGLYTVTGVGPYSSSVRVAREMGCRLERHRATHWLDFDHREGDLYLVMEPRHAEHLMRRGVAPQRIALLGHWARPRRLRIRDPHLKSERELRRCFALIRAAVGRLVAEVQATGRMAPRPAHADPREAQGGKASGAKAGAGIAWTETHGIWRCRAGRNSRPPGRCIPGPWGARRPGGQTRAFGRLTFPERVPCSALQFRCPNFYWPCWPPCRPPARRPRAG